ncbi:hypothetical protein [Desulfotomaculum copahuensis]|uniref:hypothetical protein n=1 Tax=Desulfotomaculum copahuensis TaxID=1838280 RepID=UPI0013729F58|nr:hypothetical protein [Desulfotomaculum copahuensis]
MDKPARSQLFQVIRIPALRQNPVTHHSDRIVIGKLPGNYYIKAINLATNVFTVEQDIPGELVPLKKELNPQWWCARIDEDIYGVAASWTEETIRRFPILLYAHTGRRQIWPRVHRRSD